MVQYDFMSRDNIEKRDIQSYVKEKYGVLINGKSWLEVDSFCEKLEEIFRSAWEKQQLDLNDIFEEEFEKVDDRADEVVKLQERFPLIYKIIGDWEKYAKDLLADSYMGMLQADKNYNIVFKDAFKQCWEADACNKSIDMENAKKHYPFADISDFLKDGIPGGCEAYHELMIQQKNIGIFDIGTDIKTLQRYAFPRTSNIYHALEDSPIENLLLLERTQGIGYTNQLFYYIKDIKQKEQLDRLSNIIACGLKIPMFIRKDIVDIIWSYLNRFEYNDISIQYAETIIDNIAYVVKYIYRNLLEFHWYVFYLAYLEKQLSGVGLYLKQYWQQYFDENKVYNEYIKEEKLQDWRNIKTVTDCFYPLDNTLKCIWNGSCESCEKRDGCEVPLAVIREKVEIIDFEMADGRLYKIVAAIPINGLGKKIKEEANIIFQNELKYLSIEELSKEYEKLENRYYAIRKQCFEKKKKQEQKLWLEKDLKEPENRLKTSHIYAIIHKDIVKLLN